MRIIITLFFVILVACQTQNSKVKSSDNDVGKPKTLQTVETDKNDSINENARWKCNEEICLQLRNHDASKKSFEIHMINSVPIFGFQCDLQGIEIINSIGGLLQENEYQTSNSVSRLLSFSMQAKPIPVGMGILTEVHYDNPEDVVCMTKIIFAGIGGSKLSNNIPECMKLD